MESGTSNPLVTMPSHDLVELPEAEDEGLTSPNLVHSINPGMSLASATNFARMQSSSYSHQERKESSSSSVTKMQGDQVVSSAQNSSSSASRTDSAATGQLAIGQDGQMVMSGTKVQSSSSESHESSSERKLMANGAMTSSATSSHSFSKKSTSSTVTNVTSRSLLSSSQVRIVSKCDKCIFQLLSFRIFCSIITKLLTRQKSGLNEARLQLHISEKKCRDSNSEVKCTL